MHTSNRQACDGKRRLLQGIVGVSNSVLNILIVLFVCVKQDWLGHGKNFRSSPFRIPELCTYCRSSLIAT